jgi:hypothetical protein
VVYLTEKHDWIIFERSMIAEAKKYGDVDKGLLTGKEIDYMFEMKHLLEQTRSEFTIRNPIRRSEKPQASPDVSKLHIRAIMMKTTRLLPKRPHQL